MGQNPLLPHRNTDSRFASINRHTSLVIVAAHLRVGR
jgi:hypothetical protein